LQKQAAKWGNFGNAGTDRKPIGTLRMKIVSQFANSRDGCKIGTVFEVKKEIPVDTALLLNYGAERKLKEENGNGAPCSFDSHASVRAKHSFAVRDFAGRFLDRSAGLER
jgi:hypothetical protein